MVLSVQAAMGGPSQVQVIGPVKGITDRSSGAIRAIDAACHEGAKKDAPVLFDRFCPGEPVIWTVNDYELDLTMAASRPSLIGPRRSKGRPSRSPLTVNPRRCRRTPFRTSSSRMRSPGTRQRLPQGHHPGRGKPHSRSNSDPLRSPGRSDRSSSWETTRRSRRPSKPALLRPGGAPAWDVASSPSRSTPDLPSFCSIGGHPSVSTCPSKERRARALSTMPRPRYRRSQREAS
jgi:hypothetical protein